jgi:hypothetical protein
MPTKYEVIIGRDFPIGDVTEKDVLNVGLPESVELLSAKHGIGMREVLTWAFLIGFAVALVLSALIGWNDESFNEFTTVWGAGAVWFGFLLKAYFSGD